MTNSNQLSSVLTTTHALSLDDSEIYYGAFGSISIIPSDTALPSGHTYHLFRDTKLCDNSPSHSDIANAGAVVINAFNLSSVDSPVNNFSAKIVDIFGNESNCARLDYIYDITAPAPIATYKCGTSGLDTFWLEE